MATNDTTGAKWVRGLVKTIFIACYVAFLWASIHHIATYFNDFEQNSGNTVGSYALAGAFDITALVTTIGVMFFRKSMPTWVLVIVWAFILAIAAYSFFINWEYASHYQHLDLIMQPTGATTPVYDARGIVHYVPVMQANTALIWINPILASGFTIFSLIYSVIAEFFGTRLPTAGELLARKQYLEETGSLLEEIKVLEEKNKKPSLVQRTRSVVKEVKEAANELISPPQHVGDRRANVRENVNDMPSNHQANEPDHEMDITEGMDADHDAKGAENAEEKDVFSDEEEGENTSQYRDHLGMIEGAMYDRLLADISTLSELVRMAKILSISELTRLLQRRFSGYAHMINETRVSQVFEAIKADYPDLISQAQAENGEPSTDAEQTTISDANGPQHPSDLPAVEMPNVFANEGESLGDIAAHPDGNEGINETQITERVETNEDETDSEMPSNITPILRAKAPRITGKLEQGAQPNRAAHEGNVSHKKGAYAITKQAAAEALGCPISEIERGIAEEGIKPFAKDPDKVLRSSLEGFVPRRRSRKTAKISATPK
jgi:hypothetical protein